jgi:hypothetical protein
VTLRVGGEIVKTIEDVSGDAATGIASLATPHGAPLTARVGLAFAQATVPYRVMLVAPATLMAAACYALQTATVLLIVVRGFRYHSYGMPLWGVPVQGDSSRSSARASARSRVTRWPGNQPCVSSTRRRACSVRPRSASQRA